MNITSKTARRWLGLMLAVAALAVAACGGGSSSSTTSSASSPPAASSSSSSSSAGSSASGIPQGQNAGDADSDNHGGPSDGDGNL